MIIVYIQVYNIQVYIAYINCYVLHVQYYMYKRQGKQLLEIRHGQKFICIEHCGIYSIRSQSMCLHKFPEM